MIEEIKNIPNSNRDIRSFGITMGIILFIISGLLMYYDKESYQLIAIIARSPPWLFRQGARALNLS